MMESGYAPLTTLGHFSKLGNVPPPVALSQTSFVSSQIPRRWHNWTSVTGSVSIVCSCRAALGNYGSDIGRRKGSMGPTLEKNETAEARRMRKHQGWIHRFF